MLNLLSDHKKLNSHSLLSKPGGEKSKNSISVGEKCPLHVKKSKLLESESTGGVDGD